MSLQAALSLIARSALGQMPLSMTIQPTTGGGSILMAENHRTPEERFRLYPGKRISSWLSIRHGRGHACGHGQTVVMTYRRDTIIVLDMDEAKRLRAWLNSVIP